MDLQTLAQWLIGGGGAGVVIYAAIEEFGKGLTAKGKRYAVIFGTAALIAAAYYLSVVAGYNPDPGDVQGWIEAMTPPILTALGVSQVIHAERQL